MPLLTSALDCRQLLASGLQVLTPPVRAPGSGGQAAACTSWTVGTRSIDFSSSEQLSGLFRRLDPQAEPAPIRDWLAPRSP